MTEDPRSNDEVARADASPEDPELGEILAEQDQEAQQFAIEFIKKVVRIRGVRIERAKFLQQELRKIHISDATIARALESSPAQAGVPVEQIDELARQTISFETRKSALVSTAAGLPGGFAMLATIPGDITQYYVHAFRVMQKLTFLYGWSEFLGDLDEADDETIGKLALFLGVMMGVGGASASLTTFANQVARPTLQKQIAKQALTKTAWYGPMKKTLGLIGIKLTKDSLAKSVTKAVPLAGGAISGTMTFVSLKSQAVRLQQRLREMPPPGVDAAAYLADLQAVDEARVAKESGGIRASAADAAHEVAAGARRRGNEAMGAASRAGTWARSVVRRGKNGGESADEGASDEQ